MDVTGFDKWAPCYDGGSLQTVLYHPMHQTVLREAARLCPRPRRLLDLGCGTGHLLARAAARHPGTTLIGVDRCAGMLTRAASAVPDAYLVQAAAERLPLADASVDVVVCTATIRHWTSVADGLREARRVLTPAGVLVIADFFPAPQRRTLWRRGTGLPDAVRECLTTSGLLPYTVRRVDGFGPLTDVTIIVAGT